MPKLPKQTSESFKRLNPHLFPTGNAKEVMSPDDAIRGDRCIAAPLQASPVTAGERASAPNTRQSTKLVFQKSTDESKLNKTEAAWLAELRLLYPADHIGIQSITLKLADDTRYTPDFWTIDAHGQLQFWEVKGFFRDDAKAKIKIASRQFRWARFILVRRQKKQWLQTPVPP